MRRDPNEASSYLQAYIRWLLSLGLHERELVIRSADDGWLQIHCPLGVFDMPMKRSDLLDESGEFPLGSPASPPAAEGGIPSSALNARKPVHEVPVPQLEEVARGKDPKAP